MEPYVDFFGFMAYDLHGFWDADVQTLGSIVRAQVGFLSRFESCVTCPRACRSEIGE